MKVNKFGPIWWGSAAMGFFGEGYWYHRYIRWLGFWFTHLVTLVAKTTTLEKREGNMPMREDGITPIEKYPRCVFVNWFGGHMLNSVSLAGPGAEDLFQRGRYQSMRKPYMISFMSLEANMDERLREFAKFTTLVLRYFSKEQLKLVGLQVNMSCPNVSVSYTDFPIECGKILDAASILGIPVYIKLCVTTSPELLLAIQNHPALSGVCVSNALPWYLLPNELKYKIAGSLHSPLEQYGGGGYSGKWLLPHVINWVKRARAAGITCHINAGGGILTCFGMFRLWKAGADSFSMASVKLLRFWRVWRLILFAYILAGLPTKGGCHGKRA